MAKRLQRELQLPFSRRVLECRTLHQSPRSQSAWRRASIQIQPPKTALIAGGFNPGRICESLCFSAAASGLRYEEQRQLKPNQTLIRVGSKNGGTPGGNAIDFDVNSDFVSPGIEGIHYCLKEDLNQRRVREKELNGTVGLDEHKEGLAILPASRKK